MPSLKNQWEKFETLCLIQATDQERHHAKVAFYAGCTSLLGTQEKLTRDGITDVEAIKQHNNWWEEIRGFQKELMLKFKDENCH